MKRTAKRVKRKRVPTNKELLQQIANSLDALVRLQSASSDTLSAIGRVQRRQK